MKIHHPLILAVLVLALAACHMTPFAVQPLGTKPGSEARVLAPDIIGRVEFPTERSTLATPAQVINEATVSLIDEGGTTVVSGFTNASGAFTLVLGAFSPETGSTYILEAIKGLQAQLPGFDAPRFRTILMWNGSAWLSITNNTAGGPIVLNALTTAVAVESALDPLNVPRAITVGKVNTSGSPAVLNPSPTFTGHPDAEIVNLSNDITSYLTNDMDPVAVVNAIRPSITQVTPSSGYARDIVSLYGSGFHPVSGGTTVRFNGTLASVLLATSDRLIVTVPSGATSGNIVVSTTRGGLSNGLYFSVPNGSPVVIETVSPNPVGERGTITITGRGFSATPASNTVTFTRSGGGTTTGVVGASGPTSLYVTLPNDAVSGNVTATVAGQTSNAYFLTVNAVPRVNEIFPNRVTRYGKFYVYGENLGGATGIVTVGGENAIIKQWKNTWIEALVPFQAALGAQTVRVTTADNKTITGTMTVLRGDVGAWSNIGTASGISGQNPAPVWSHKWFYVAGGGAANAGVTNGKNIIRFPLDDTLDDGSIVVASQANVGQLRWPLGSNDMAKHWFGWTHPTKFWLATNNDVQKQYMTFDENTGAYQATYDAGPANYGPAVGDSGCVATDKALYILTGGDTGGSAATYAYALIHKEDGTIGPWVNHNNLSGYASGDAIGVVFGGTLFALWYGNVKGIALNPDGTAPATGWADYSTNPLSSNHIANVLHAGDYLYTFGQWTSGTLIWRATVQQGTLLAGNWTSYTNPNTTTFPANGAPIVIGGYAYIISGYGSSGTILRAPIN